MNLMKDLNYCRLVTHEPLIVKGLSLEGTAGLKEKVPAFLGVGISSRDVLSCGLPVDVLSMVLMSELVGTEKYVLVADEHAKFNGFDEGVVKNVASLYSGVLSSVLGSLGLSGWKVLLGSDIGQSADYQNILKSVDEKNGYVKRELADMVWFAERGVKLKIGWSKDEGCDFGELFFDNKFRELDRAEMSFLYLKSGRTFNPDKPFSAPYFCDNAENRVMLCSGEDVGLKISSAQKRFGKNKVSGYLRFLNDLMDLYDCVIRPVKEQALENRLQYVIDRCCHDI